MCFFGARRGAAVALDARRGAARLVQLWSRRYFERSPFFERGDGIEFHIEPEMGDPRCVVICRRRRRDGREAEVEAYYYVLEGTIYQCPRADELVRSHVRKAGAARRF